MKPEREEICDPNYWLLRRGIPYTPELLTDPRVDNKLRRRVSPFVTNIDQPVFALTSQVPSEVGGVLLTKYSRAREPLRLILATEFLDILGDGGGKVQDRGKVDEYFGRILSGFGDDSPAQLGGVQMAAEMISNMAAKAVEDGRIGIGYMEKSSRYVPLDEQVNGKFLFLRPAEIMQSDLAGEYEELMNEAFIFFGMAYHGVLKYVREKYPKKDEDDDRAYLSATRSKALDIARVFLPMATLTNVGIAGNAQAMELMINKMKTSSLVEEWRLGDDLYKNAEKVVGSMVGRVETKHGEKFRDYLDQSRRAIARVRTNMIGNKESREKIEPGVRLSFTSADNLDRVVAAMLFEGNPGPETERDFLNMVSQMGDEQKSEIIDEVLKGRTNRRHKPPRAFEKASYNFEIRSKVGEWRDLQRMRMNTLQRGLLTTEIGFSTPEEFFEISVYGEKLAKVYQWHMEKRSQLYRRITEKISPEVAQYVVAFGHYLDWSVFANLRQMYHWIPLRAGPGAHADYRRISLQMYEQIVKVDPELARPMEKFLDLEAEKQELERMAQLNKAAAKGAKIE